MAFGRPGTIAIAMPKGPKGEKRPADAIGAAVKVMKNATGEIEEDAAKEKDSAAVERGREGGTAGGAARAKQLTPKQRQDIAKKAVTARWRHKL